MMINDMLEVLAERGGYVESFKVRYGWRGTSVQGPAVVAVLRHPAGNTTEFVDYTAVNPAIITLEEYESCPSDDPDEGGF
jgi:hypothetical protein